MNPESQPVRPNVETAPQIPGAVEFFPDGTIRGPEVGPGSPEQQTAAPVEQLTQSAQLAVPAMPAPPIAAIPQAPTTTTVPTDDNPAIAADDDLIEKEWVDKVKKIIVLTKGSPYEQAKAIAALQADYLKKRYNRTLGESDGL